MSKEELQVICDVEHELGLRAVPEQYDLFLSCLLWLHYQYKIEYGVLKYKWDGKWHEKAYCWCESNDGRIIDINLFLPTDMTDPDGDQIVVCKSPIIGGHVKMTDLKETMKSHKGVKYVFLEELPKYFPQAEVINHAIQNGKIDEGDFFALTRIITVDPNDTREVKELVSKNKAKEYIRTHAGLLASAIRQFTKLKLKFL
jgi:hypothetical protein